ncbi:MAG: hypothetical protein K8T26_06855 [Lentisphaerae bacterium]|nr:hypothetical protein [Lentisphaerota bacterium]
MGNLKSVLVVLAVVMVLAALSVGGFVFTHGGRDVSIPESVRNQARSTALLLQEARLQGGVDLDGYVATQAIVTSTELWRRLVQDHALGVDMAWFAAPGVPPFAGADAAGFSASNNAWCVSLGITTNSARGMPLLFTRNLHFTNVDGVVRAYLEEEAPFGRTAAVMVDAGGTARTIKGAGIERLAWPLAPADLDRMLRP